VWRGGRGARGKGNGGVVSRPKRVRKMRVPQGSTRPGIAIKGLHRPWDVSSEALTTLGPFLPRILRHRVPLIGKSLRAKTSVLSVELLNLPFKGIRHIKTSPLSPMTRRIRVISSHHVARIFLPDALNKITILPSTPSGNRKF
jgi:hypothetical protein